MNKFILCLVLSLALTTTHAQIDSTRTIQFYISGGMKLLSEKTFADRNNISPHAVPTVGGGVLLRNKNIQFGGDFSYADGKKHTTEFGTILTGIHFNLLLGWTTSLSSQWNIAATTGFGYTLNHLSMTDKTYGGVPHLNTAIYHNMSYSIPLALTLQRMNINGTFTAIRLSYSFTAGANEWKYIEGTKTDTYYTNSDGLQVQLILGGAFERKLQQP